LVDSTFIVLESNEKEEGVAKPQLEAQVARTNKILGVCFQHAPIDVDEEMEDIEEIGGMNTQLETSR
jgi:hypothetical protein